MPLIIGVTSLPGSGASTVAKFFAKLGFKVINADKIAHKLLKKSSVKKRLAKEFGKKIFSKNEINRKKLAEIAFKNKKSLQKLNKILHPKILAEIKKTIKEKKIKNKNLVLDAPLLFEKKLHKFCDINILVVAKKETCIKRLCKKGFSKRIAEKILQIHKLKFKKEKADYLLSNNSSLKELERKVINLWKKIEKK